MDPFVSFRVLNLRHDFNLTQEKFAERSGLSRDEISRIERRGRDPQMTTVVALARGFGMTLAEFFSTAEALPPLADKHQRRMARLDSNLRSADEWMADRVVEVSDILCQKRPEERRKARTPRAPSPRRPRPSGSRGARMRPPVRRRK